MTSSGWVFEIVQGEGILDTPGPGSCVHELTGVGRQAAVSLVGMGGGDKEVTEPEAES